VSGETGSGTCDEIEFWLVVYAVNHRKCMVAKSINPISSQVPGALLFWGPDSDWNPRPEIGGAQEKSARRAPRRLGFAHSGRRAV